MSKENNQHNLAVIGLSCRFPGANNHDEFWSNLLLGKESITHFSDEALSKAGVSKDILDDPNYIKSKGIIENIDYFDADFFGFSDNDAKILDPQVRLFLECARNSLEDAGYYSEEQGGKIGIFAGQSQFNTYLKEHILKNPNIIKLLGDYYIHLNNSSDFLATKVSYKLNLTGPSYTLQTACSTSLVAVAEACQHLLDYQCDLALAGGVSLQLPMISGYHYQEGMILSPDGHCRAFDEQANGTVPSNGVGVVTLKRYQDAMADKDPIYAIIKGFAVNNDGHKKVGYSAPSVQGQASVIQEAIAMACCEPDSITYIEAHGTGTRQGDPVEIEALKSVFSTNKNNTQKNCAIGSVKTNIGHCDIASGIAGFIKTVLALYYKKIPATLHFNKLNSLIDITHTPFFINNTLLEWQVNQSPRRAGVSSFGIGGTNAHIVLQENVPTTVSENTENESDGYVLLPLSAKSKHSLQQIKDNLCDFIEKSTDIKLLDIAYTHQIGRAPFKHRCFFVLKDKNLALKELKAPISDNDYALFPEENPRQIAFLFPGQGSRIENFFEIYQREQVFRDHIDTINVHVKNKLNLNLKDWLFPKIGSERDLVLLQHGFMMQQLCLFSQTFALAKLWIHWGIYPDIMIGHSLGEYVAACISDVLSPEGAIDILISRSRYLQSVPDGKMVVVQLSQAQIKPYLTDGLSIAASNAENICTISGSHEDILQLLDKMKIDGVVYKEILVTKPFHSHLLNAIKKPFADSIRHIVGKPPTIPYFSNITGNKIELADVHDSVYWAKQMCQPVKFYESISSLKGSNFLFLEIGASNTLSSLVKKTIKTSVCIPSISQSQLSLGVYASLLKAMGSLWIHGVQPLWNNFLSQRQARRISLPTYPFLRQKHCIEAPMMTHVLEKKANVDPYIYEPFWQRQEIDYLSQDNREKLTILIFHDQLRISTFVREKLAAAGHDLIDVYCGDRFLQKSTHIYYMNGTLISDCENLMASIAKNSTVDGVLFFPALVNQTHKIGKLPRYFLYAFNIIKTIDKFFYKKKLFFSILTNRVWRVCCNERFDPLKATLVGISKTTFYDVPEIIVKIVDTDFLDAENAAKITYELLLPHRENITYRHGKRFCLSYKQILLDKDSKENFLLKENGTYVITGGLGGVGLSMADAFSKIKPLNIVLIQRSYFPENNIWDVWEKSHEADDIISKKIQILKGIVARGSKIIILQVDVTREKEMQKAFSLIKKQFFCISGVIHAAGLPDGSLFRSQTSESLETVMSSKIDGALILYKILKNESVDFMLFCSALVAITGGIGQLAYCSANNFLDSFAQACKDQKNRVFSINWDLWQETGMASNISGFYKNLECKEWLASTGLDKSSNIQFLWKALSYQMPQFILSSDSLSERIAKYKKISDSYLNVDSPYVGEDKWIENLENAEEHPIYIEVLKLFSVYLGTKKVFGHTDFFACGGDSLLAIRLADAVEKKFSIKIYPHHIQQFPNPQALANYISEQLNAIDINHPPENASLPFSLVSLQEGDRRNFLFLIHPVGGTFYIYRDLLKYLPKNVTVYGIQAQNLEKKEAAYTTIREIASNYVSMIKLVQPGNACYLGGFSFGGIVAYEMAQQLSASGSQVEAIIMLDSPHYKTLPQAFTDNADIISYLLGVGSGYLISPQDLRKLSREKQIQLFLQHSDKIGNALPSENLDVIERFFEIFKINSKAMSEYIPDRYIGQSKILYFKASQRDPINPASPELGWIELLSDQIKIYPVPGNHITMMFEPNVHAISSALCDFLSESCSHPYFV